MSQRQPAPDTTKIFQVLQQAYEAQESDSARVKALMTAHITACLLLSERMEELSVLIGSLVEEMQTVRYERRNSNGSRDSSSRSPSNSSTGGKPGEQGAG